MAPFWLRLIRYHKKQGRYALSFPFIVGAYQLMNLVDRISIDVVEMIVHSIASETPEESYVVVTECDIVGNNLVFTVGSSYYKPPSTYTQVSSAEREECKLFVARKILQTETSNVRIFTEYLWERYRDDLLNRKFSFSNGIFTDFDEADKKLIFNALPDDEIESM